MSPFASTIAARRYMHPGEKTWDDVARRVAHTVMAAAPVPVGHKLIRDIEVAIAERKFMPGGRYLGATGRPFHQVQNCLLLQPDDTREGWAAHLSNVTMASMSGAGLGGCYSRLRERGAPLHRTGGIASGPVPLMLATNEVGRAAMQGGDRRAALWAGLHWWHPDVMEFIGVKNWSPEIRAMKARDFNAPAPMDFTNISVCLDDKFFCAMWDEAHPQHDRASKVYWTVVRQMMETGEPGFSVDVGPNAGEWNRNAPVHADTRVLTLGGYRRVGDLVGLPHDVWTGKQWAPDVVFRRTGVNVPTVKVTMSGGREIVCDPSHPFLVERYTGAGVRRKLASVDRVAAGDLQPQDIVSVSLPKPEIIGCDDTFYALGFVYGDGSFVGNDRAEVTICAQDKLCALPRLRALPHTDGEPGKQLARLYFKGHPGFVGADKEVAPMFADPGAVASFLAGLFDADGNADPKQKRVRLASVHRSFLDGVARMLEQIGILANVSKGGSGGYRGRNCWQLVVASDYMHRFMDVVPTLRVRLDLGDFKSYRASHVRVISVEESKPADVFCADVGVPEHCFQAEGVLVSNCTEVTSYDDSDICNLGSINMARVSSLEEMRHLVRISTAFLLAGTCYSDVPYPKVRDVRFKNRRLGLGLMGLHEWLLMHGHKYGPCEALEPYLDAYAQSTNIAASFSFDWGLSEPVKTRAIAPTGTIGIVAETTTGIEPIFCVAYKRRYHERGQWHVQYVVDPTAKRLIDGGMRPEDVEDAYTLAATPERRVAFQAWVQRWVDHGISSTLNLPAWGSDLNNEDRVQAFGDMLLKHLPALRGITVYPDGARDGQPLTPCSYSEAVANIGRVVVEQADICVVAKGGEGCGA